MIVKGFTVHPVLETKIGNIKMVVTFMVFKLQLDCTVDLRLMVNVRPVLK